MNITRKILSKKILRLKQKSGTVCGSAFWTAFGEGKGFDGAPAGLSSERLRSDNPGGLFTCAKKGKRRVADQT